MIWERESHRLGLLAVNGHRHLGIVRREKGLESGQVLARAAGAHNLVRHTVQIAQGVISLVLQHELEAWSVI